MVHCTTFAEAAAAAGTACAGWKNEETGEKLDVRALGRLNLTVGTEGFFVVSREGAIGFTAQYEYQVRWLFVPLEESEQQATLESLKKELEQEQENIQESDIAAEALALLEKYESMAKTPETPDTAPGETIPAAAVPEAPATGIEDSPEVPFNGGGEEKKPAAEPLREAEKPVAVRPEEKPQEPGKVVEGEVPLRCRSMIAAARIAIASKCEKWKFQDDEDEMDRDQLLCAAEEHAASWGLDEDDPDCYFYLVSAEGAIAMTEDDGETLTWYFLPTGIEVSDLPTSWKKGEVWPKFAPKKPADARNLCVKCGKPVNPGSKFCMNCGTPVAAAQQAAPAVAGFCKKCGTKRAPGDKFCMNCGNKF